MPKSYFASAKFKSAISRPMLILVLVEPWRKVDMKDTTNNTQEPARQNTGWLFNLRQAQWYDSVIGLSYVHDWQQIDRRKFQVVTSIGSEWKIKASNYSGHQADGCIEIRLSFPPLAIMICCSTRHIIRGANLYRDEPCKFKRPHDLGNRIMASSVVA